jgi:hypothetical protein
VRLAVEWDAPPGTERVVCLDRFDLQSLPHGWHSIAAVGIPGSTTFYVDGRRRGAVPEMVCAPIVWLGNCFASDGRPDAAVGGLSDLRVGRAKCPAPTLVAASLGPICTLPLCSAPVLCPCAPRQPGRCHYMSPQSDPVVTPWRPPTFPPEFD